MKALLLIIVFLIAIIALLYIRRNALKYIPQNNEEFAKTISDKTIQLIDVRTPEEYALGHIPGACNMDVNADGFARKITTLDKQKPVAVYCRSGKRSKIAARELASMGFKVYELDSGMINWNGKIQS